MEKRRHNRIILYGYNRHTGFLCYCIPKNQPGKHIAQAITPKTTKRNRDGEKKLPMRLEKQYGAFGKYK